ncbi:transporter substrate-binding domain-containing protein [Sphingomonas cavernae]|uniref:Lytic transglycosylase F n=1 Tax=Sphingomonas cavernae TaxID=2320861 RepID=A0A418W7U0_9SPHN|nr:transporter substrate-binding domain-containing protein [Sphingomonas cavernae]RJF86068.1 lytic transglycosylase F [Sphingomonas cavernae]
MKTAWKALALIILATSGGCSGSEEQTKSGAERPAKQADAGRQPDDAPLAPPAYQMALPDELRPLVDRPFTGDLDGLVERRIVRAGVPFNRTFYFIDKGVQRGLSFEYLTLFEEQLNKSLNTGNLRIHVVPLPMPRDMLIEGLRTGKLDMVIAQLTITPERLKLVDFTNPTRPNVDEIVVTGPGSPQIASLDGLSGKKVFARKSSSYYVSLQALNRDLKARGKAPVDIAEAPENLEDDDLLEMVNAGLIPAIVVDNYLADYWKQIFPNLNVHHALTLRKGGNLAVAVRKGTPKLMAELNAFIAKNGMKSAIGAVLAKRYLQSTDYLKNAASDTERRKFLEMAELFRKYGGQYQFDYLLMAAQGYQESRLDQGASSHVGAIGVMQLMPATGKEQGVGDIRQLEPNIHAGVKYMRFMRDRYYEGQPMTPINKGLFTFASYNAGPGRIQKLRNEAAQRGLDPNVWFGNVERIASERIGRETVTYVGNIYKYYIAYKLIAEERERRAAARAKIQAAAQ